MNDSSQTHTEVKIPQAKIVVGLDLISYSVETIILTDACLKYSLFLMGIWPH